MIDPEEHRTDDELAAHDRITILMQLDMLVQRHAANEDEALVQEIARQACAISRHWGYTAPEAMRRLAGRPAQRGLPSLEVEGEI